MAVSIYWHPAKMHARGIFVAPTLLAGVSIADVSVETYILVTETNLTWLSSLLDHLSGTDIWWLLSEMSALNTVSSKSYIQDYILTPQNFRIHGQCG
jgi:hypothetical protein